MTSKETSLRIAIDARFKANQGFGGVESVMIGLISALSSLKDGDEQYLIIGPAEDYDWLEPYIGPNQQLVAYPAPSVSEHTGRSLGPLRPAARRIFRTFFPSPVVPEHQWPDVPISDGFYESLNCDVLHFPHQLFILCALPTIYNPHDLQHLHYPGFFDARSIAYRETIYPAGCHFANTVVTASAWAKRDIARNYGTDPEKIQVIPWSAPTQAYSDPGRDLIDAVREKFDLGSPFAFYPAMTWQHKNHLRLLEALALTGQRYGNETQLICTGHQNEFWPRIEQQIAELGLQKRARFLGLVEPAELRAIYKLAQFVIIPTLFEAASGPLFEAWAHGTPAACSTVTSLPEQAGDAALLFDPLNVEAIAEALMQMSTSDSLREDLKRRGQRRLRDFSWERTAKAYRAVYRRAAGRSLGEEDRALLNWDWMGTVREPRRLDYEGEKISS
jgi:glycosyltransferase involved in cell wall biosynthesis